MSTAKYYCYRNLNTGGFSLKHRGLVCDRSNSFKMESIDFNISEKGQSRVRKHRARNVHAYATSSNKWNQLTKEEANRLIKGFRMREITYNPYTTDTFIFKDTGKSVLHNDFIIGLDGKLYG